MTENPRPNDPQGTTDTHVTTKLNSAYKTVELRCDVPPSNDYYSMTGANNIDYTPMSPIYDIPEEIAPPAPPHDFYKRHAR